MIIIPHTQRFYSGTTNTSGNTQANPIGTKYSKEAVFLLDVTAITGTLDLEIKIYNPLTKKWHKLATYDRISGTGQDEGFVLYGLGEKIALKYTVCGSVTFTLDVSLK